MKNRDTLVLLCALGLLHCVAVEPDEPEPTPDAASVEASDDAAESEPAPTGPSGDASDGGDELLKNTAVFDEAGDASDTGASSDAADVADEPEPCVPCSNPQELRCSDDLTHLESCDERPGGCLGWHVAASCGADQICCRSHCVAANTTNCYGCGTTCGGVTPVCDKTLKGCGCDDASCRTLGPKVCDPSTHQCTIDKTRPDVYVDPTGDLVEDGSIEHPYKTITVALQAPRAQGSVLHVHIAKGRYDKEHGETFPLVVRGASLEGKGPIDTIIVGSGTYDATVPMGAINAQVSATVVVGDSAQKSGISNVMLYDTVVTPTPAQYGVFCDRGNAASQAPPAPNTTVDQVEVGPGYDVGIVATTSKLPAAVGCNLQITGTEFSVIDAGVWAVGCDNPGNLDPTPSRTPVALQLGNDTAKGGNHFSGFSVEGGLGVRVSGCVPTFNASYNAFYHTAGGIDALAPKHADEINQFVLTHNDFRELLQFGIKLAGATITVTDLSYNSFTSITPLRLANVPADALAAGLLVEGLSTDTSIPVIANATYNQFTSNQAGVVFESKFALGMFGGNSTLKGSNAFHCNAANSYADPYGFIGGDVIIRGTNFYKGFDFDDNEWDHVPLTTQTSLTVDGTDLTVTDGTTVTTAGATEAAQSCERP